MIKGREELEENQRDRIKGREELEEDSGFVSFNSRLQAEVEQIEQYKSTEQQKITEKLIKREGLKGSADKLKKD